MGFLSRRVSYRVLGGTGWYLLFPRPEWKRAVNTRMLSVLSQRGRLDHTRTSTSEFAVCQYQSIVTVFHNKNSSDYCLMNTKKEYSLLDERGYLSQVKLQEKNPPASMSSRLMLKKFPPPLSRRSFPGAECQGCFRDGWYLHQAASQAYQHPTTPCFSLWAPLFDKLRLLLRYMRNISLLSASFHLTSLSFPTSTRSFPYIHSFSHSFHSFRLPAASLEFPITLG